MKFPQSFVVGVSGVSGSILLHHSRNTAQKQWSETQVLTLSGICRVFSLKKDQFMSTLNDFEKSWKSLLGFIEFASLSKNSEVSISALKCFKEILCISTPYPEETVSTSKTAALDELRSNLWLAAWKSWLTIGLEATRQPADGEIIDVSSIKKVNNAGDAANFYIPSQAFLTSLVQLFPYMFSQVRSKFTVKDFDKLSYVLRNAIAVPVDVATQAYLMSATAHSADHQNQSALTVGHSAPLTPLHEAISFVLEIFRNDILVALNGNSPSNEFDVFVPVVFKQMLDFVSCACTSPTYGKMSTSLYSMFSSSVSTFA